MGYFLIVCMGCVEHSLQNPTDAIAGTRKVLGFAALYPTYRGLI